MASPSLKYIRDLVRRKGLRLALTDVAYRRLVRPALDTLSAGDHRRELARILAEHASRHIIVLPTSIGWNIPLFQRSQHMARELARSGFLYFYVVKPRWPEEREVGFREVYPGCFVTTRSDLVLALNRPVVLHIYSPDTSLGLDRLRQHQERGDTVLYEFIDEIHEGVMQIVDRTVLRRHDALLRDETVPCTASADRLLERVAAARDRNFCQVTNGVNLPDFAKGAADSPEAMTRLRRLGKPIVGYYGALAPWVDFDLIAAIARTGRYTVCLIGPLHTLQSFRETGLVAAPDVHWLGPVPYVDLPAYAMQFDVSMIPFKINDITESTSPVKLFEYMALGKPIVTTDMRECRKYKSVVIGQSHDDFIAKLDGALRGDYDESHYRFLAEEAEQNSWAAKARQIAGLLADKHNDRTIPAIASGFEGVSRE